MSWNIQGPFKLVKNPNRHYVIQLSNKGKAEISVPKNIINKRSAAAWLRAHPGEVARARFKPKNPWPVPVVPVPFKPLLIGGLGQEHVRFSCGSGKYMTVLDHGRQGVVLKAPDHVAKVCPRDLRAESRGERQPAIVEFEIHKEIYKVAPGGVVEPYKFEKCVDFVPPTTMNILAKNNKIDKSKQSIIFMEYCSGGTLQKWLGSRRQSDASLHHVITSVLKTLKKIKQKFPEFRHNDLHMGNIFVASRGFLIGDFGWARIQKMGTNPAVNTANKSGTAGEWGIGPDTDPRYDAHLFLNTLRGWVVRNKVFPKTEAFLDVAVPPGYRGTTDTHVKESRLKYKDPCPGLPTIEELLKNKFITGRKFNSPNLVAAKSRLRKVPFLGRPKRVRSADLLAAKARLRRRTPVRPRITTANIVTAKMRLRPVGPRGRVTSAQIRSGRRKLKARVPTKKKITLAMMKNKRFNKIIEYYWNLNGRPSGANFENAWALAKTKATRLVERRLNAGNAPFSPVKVSPKRTQVTPPPPPKRANLLRVEAPTTKRANLLLMGARLKAIENRMKAARPTTALVKNITPTNLSYTQSPSGRIKVKNPYTGRFVYVDGPSVTLEFLKNMAVRKGVNVKGLRSKNAIARKIFGI